MFFDSGSGPRGVKLTALTAPSESLLMCDSQRNDGLGTWYLYSLKTYTYPLGASETSTNSIPVPGRHNGGNNVGFCDGHAKAMVVTSSRHHAVKYKREIDAYIATKMKEVTAFRAATHPLEYQMYYAI